jgi:hypothetical protein
MILLVPTAFKGDYFFAPSVAHMRDVCHMKTFGFAFKQTVSGLELRKVNHFHYCMKSNNSVSVAAPQKENDLRLL